MIARSCLTPDHTSIVTDLNDVSYVKAAISDANGGVATNSSAAATFAITGPGTIIAVDSGSMTNATFFGNTRNASPGLAIRACRQGLRHRTGQ
jgi:beta-galactosidase